MSCQYIYIHKSDDTDWNDEQLLEITINPASGSSIDLSSLDVESIVVAEEAQVIAEMVPALHTLYHDTNKFKFSISMLGDQVITDAVIETNKNDEVEV